jgi:hypothetical protein
MDALLTEHRRTANLMLRDFHLSFFSIILLLRNILLMIRLKGDNWHQITDSSIYDYFLSIILNML